MDEASQSKEDGDFSPLITLTVRQQRDTQAVASQSEEEGNVAAASQTQ